MASLKKYWAMLRLLFLFFRYKFRTYRLTTKQNFTLNTKYGPIKGVKRISCWNDEFFSFEKIPYAKPPLGELRFKDPKPCEPWTRILDCTKESPVPLQTNLIFGKSEGSEDCLYLNVYAKNLNRDKPVPVMVWIYGGGFVSGNTKKELYSPDYFMQKDIVFISITYRVGPFGFLTFEDSSLGVPGNAGLKDQSLALRWIKENCSTFGGDPNNITVFGESAGAASVQYHMVSDHSKDLFHKAILMSGSALNPWAQAANTDSAYRLAKLMNFKGEFNDANVFEFLQNSKGSDILHVVPKLTTSEDRRNRVLFPFGPVVEPYISEQCMVPKNTVHLMRDAWSKNIPVLMGGTSFEGLLIYGDVRKNPNSLTRLDNCEYLVPLDVCPDRTTEECKEKGLRLKTTFFGDKEITKDNIFEYCDLLSYKLFWHGVHRTLLSRQKYAKAPTYLYRFDYDSPHFNHMRYLLCGKKIRGVCHGDDLSYLFLNGISDVLSPDIEEYSIIQLMIGILTEFATNNDPNINETRSVNWKPVENDEKPFKCLNISDKLEIIELPETKKLEIWDSLYNNENLI